MHYIKPHKKISQKVRSIHFQKVKELSKKMVALCRKPRGKYAYAYALAHCQVASEKPLRFFVIREGLTIINPVIINHTKFPVDSTEACMSFPDKAPITVKRFNKCEVEYKVLEKSVISGVQNQNFSGKGAKMFQHMIDLLDGKTIYDEES